METKITNKQRLVNNLKLKQDEQNVGLVKPVEDHVESPKKLKIQNLTDEIWELKREKKEGLRQISELQETLKHYQKENADLRQNFNTKLFQGLTADSDLHRFWPDNKQIFDWRKLLVIREVKKNKDKHDFSASTIGGWATVKQLDEAVKHAEQTHSENPLHYFRYFGFGNMQTGELRVFEALLQYFPDDKQNFITVWTGTVLCHLQKNFSYDEQKTIFPEKRAKDRGSLMNYLEANVRYSTGQNYFYPDQFSTYEYGKPDKPLPVIESGYDLIMFAYSELKKVYDSGLRMCIITTEPEEYK